MSPHSAAGRVRARDRGGRERRHHRRRGSSLDDDLPGSGPGTRRAAWRAPPVAGRVQRRALGRADAQARVRVSNQVVEPHRGRGRRKAAEAADPDRPLQVPRSRCGAVLNDVDDSVPLDPAGVELVVDRRGGQARRRAVADGVARDVHDAGRRHRVRRGRHNAGGRPNEDPARPAERVALVQVVVENVRVRFGPEVVTHAPPDTGTPGVATWIAAPTVPDGDTTTGPLSPPNPSSVSPLSITIASSYVPGSTSTLPPRSTMSIPS